MTAQTTTIIETKPRSKLETLWIWLKAIDDGLNYDPQEQLYLSQQTLNQKLERLQAKVQDLEECQKQERRQC